MKIPPNLCISVLAIIATLTLIAGRVSAQQIEGQVVGAGAPIANAKVTLFAATSNAPTSSPRLKAVLTATSRCLQSARQAARLYSISSPLAVNPPRIGAAETIPISRF